MFRNLFNPLGQEQNNNNNNERIFEAILTNIIQENIDNEPHGLSQESLERLRNNSFLHNGEESQQCSICLESINARDRIVNLQCEHTFHLSCIERWCESHNSCPLCRASIDEEIQQNQNQNQRRQRILVNNISIVQIVFHINGVSFTTYWNSCDTMIDVFRYLSQMHNRYNRMMVQIQNKIFKTTESYEYLAQNLSQLGILGSVNAHVHLY